MSGCTDSAAENYDSGADIDDGSCTFANGGCTDPNADNYDSSAVIDDGTCTYNPLNQISFTWVETASYGGEVSWTEVNWSRRLQQRHASGDATDRPGVHLGWLLRPERLRLGQRRLGVGRFGMAYGRDRRDDGTVPVDDFTITDVASDSTYLSVNGGCVCRAARTRRQTTTTRARTPTTGAAPTLCLAAPTPQQPTTTRSATVVDDGSCIYPAANNISFTWVETASYGGEVSWTVVNRADSTEAASGDATDQGPIYLPTGCYDFNGADSYGDGWGWAGSFWRMDVTDGDGTVLLDDFTVDGACRWSRDLLGQ